MGMDFISAGWTTTAARTTDIETVNQFIDNLLSADLIAHLDALDPSGQFEWDVDADIDRIAEMAQEIRDTLKAGAKVAFEADGRMSNTWGIRGTTLLFTVMGGGSWGDDPFDGYSPLVMFIDGLDLWPDLKQLTDIVCGGLPPASVIEQHRGEVV